VSRPVPRAAGRPRLGPVAGALPLLLCLPVCAQHEGLGGGGGDPLAQLSRMSLEQLANVEITSVSKAAQSLSTAPASVYVITREEIVRAGVLSIPEALRLAPNMQVTQISSTEYQIGARGFAGQLEAQSFSNKILIVIDGRSVYNPLFSGVAYDQLDVLMDDIERIEVISGPGATLWGSNAMNGVINIITRTAHESQGGLMRLSAGNQEVALSTRHGGRFGSDDAVRVYAKAFDRGPSESGDGASAGNRWHKAQAGFRVDAGDDLDAFTVQGDVQQATINQGLLEDFDLTQYDLSGRWERAGSRARTRLQLYYDHTRRGQPVDGVGFTLRSYDLDLQQTLELGSKHQVVWGLGRRYHDYDVTNTPTLAFVPPSRRLRLTNVFAQDTVTLSDEIRLTAGIKFEENSFTGWSTLPDLRLSWTPDDTTLVWASAARAVRSPTPFDVDVEERLGGVVLFVEGNPDFRTEKLWAYELGYRSQPSTVLSWSVNTFYNDYDDLRSIEVNPVSGFLPLLWGNGIEGSSYGAELWANVQVRPWLRLSPGLRTLRKRLRFDADSAALLGTQQAGNDPRSSAMLKSSLDFGRWSVDATLRYVGDLPSPATPSYTSLGARVAYRASERLEFALTGFNLLDDRHPEYAPPAGQQIRRSAYAELRVLY
jgi:iron complex outermembrane recepter protein